MQILNRPLINSLFCIVVLSIGISTACTSTATSGSETTGGGSSSNINQNKETAENKNADSKAKPKPSPEKPQSEMPEFKKGESYASVREKLLMAGWTPHRSKDADKCGEGDERCQGRPEMQSCAGTGMANCKFLWKRGEKMLAIFTIGEDAAYDGQQFENAQNESKKTDEPLPPRKDETMRGPGLVFAPPSFIRKSPNGEILCKVEKKILINLEGSTNVYDNNGFWIYTNHCGKMGVIHSTQVNIAS